MMENKKDLGYLVFLVVLFAIIYAFTFDSKINLGGDNLAYYYLGKSLVDGNGYANVTGPVITPHTHYPPGYPAIVAIIMLVNESVVAVKVVNGVFLVAALMLLFMVTKRIFGTSRMALLLSVFVLLNKHLLEYSFIMMSEVSFTLALLLGMYWFTYNKSKYEIFKLNHLFYLILISGLAFYLRTFGIILFASILSFFLWNKKFTYAFWFTVGFLFLLMPWSIRNWQVSGGSEYISQFLLVNPYDPQSGMLGFSDLVSRFSSNLIRYLDKELPLTIFNALELDRKSDFSFFRLAGSLSVIGSLIIGLMHLDKGYRVFFAFMLLYGFGILLIWPSEWFGERFLIPLAPAVILLSIYGCQATIKWISGRTNINFNMTTYFGVLVLILCQFPGIMELRKKKVEDYPVAYNDYFSDARWVKKNATIGAVVACRKPLLFYHLSKVPSIRFPSTNRPIEVIDYFDNKSVTYIVMDALGYASTGQVILPVLKSYPNRFRIIKKNQNTPSFVCQYLYP